MTTPAGVDVVDLARRWIEQDPDPVTRSQLQQLVDRGELGPLTELMTGRLRFGTAGLRAPLGPGPNRMNRLLVQQSCVGIAQELLASGAAGAGVVVVGHDARHGSADFAAEATETLVSMGLDVARFDGPVPTPLVAFAVRRLRAAAGLMVTASHNPATDNGLKVYWADGAQLAPPLDSNIEARIVDPAPIEVVERGRRIELGGVGELASAGGPVSVGALADGRESVGEVVADYVGAVSRRVGTGTAPVVAYTALHGVGAALFERVALESGLHVVPVRSQRDPDPDFPTVASPNPEESGAMDQLVELARGIDADLAVALDPDADRLAVAVPTGGQWRVLTGDETGALLAHHLLDVTDGLPDRFIASTVVSSRLVERMCRSAGVRHEETLTGFKWLSRPGLAHPGWTQVLLYEEALGYAVGAHDRDKDGISAAIVAVEAVTSLVGAGRDVAALLDDLARRHGAVVTRNGSLLLTAREPSAAQDLLPGGAPSRLGGLDVVRHDRPTHDVHRWWLADDTRVVLRPSGTEPKLKYYCDAVEPVADDPARARVAASARLDRIEADLLELLTSA